MDGAKTTVWGDKHKLASKQGVCMYVHGMYERGMADVLHAAHLAVVIDYFLSGLEATFRVHSAHSAQHMIHHCTQ